LAQTNDTYLTSKTEILKDGMTDNSFSARHKQSKHWYQSNHILGNGVYQDYISIRFYFFYYIYITPVNNLPLGARKPQRFTNIYNEQYNKINKYWYSCSKNTIP